jgi:hypothetical protein
LRGLIGASPSPSACESNVGEGGAKPRRQFVAFATSDVADGFQPGAAQATRDRLVSAERERPANPQSAAASSPQATIFAGHAARQRARADRGAGNGGADWQNPGGSALS